MTFSYQQTENHIGLRPGLPDHIRRALPESRREDWPSHPRYNRMASHLLSIHRSLTSGAKQLAEAFALWQTSPRDKVQDALMASRLKMAGNDLIRFAHNHHRIEDSQLFPALIRRSAHLAAAVDLLHADHEVLDAALYDLETCLTKIETGAVEQSDIDEGANKARAVSQIVSRHIQDEEEIVIPWLLGNRLG